MGWGSDPNHDPYNDFKNAVAEANLSVAIRVLTLFANIFYGPYDSAAWWQKVRDAAKRRRLKTGESCPIFQWMLPSIVFDRAEQHRPHAWEKTELASQVLSKRDPPCVSERGNTNLQWKT